MPKPTFFNLSTEKQRSLIDAAKKEFSRVPLYEASISNIIKDAGIPRGSFYQYFDGLEDIFYFLLHEHSQRNFERLISTMKMNNGDIFATIVDWFKGILIMFEEPENRQYFKNAFLNMNYKVEKAFTQNMYEEKRKSRFFEIITNINPGNLNVTNEEEIYHIFKMMMAVSFQNLIHAFAKELQINDVMKTFLLEIELLKKGFYKEPK
ncbi:TetR family transcriptional regulator [Paenibacillus sp. BSR1-1]|uniref:TetR/AcrR family transcriptional regulator n=1 Tax=Paenibacillus sp. BSR1-1 TaxID=3020845 RepID=UPI0025B02365|nr:TetR family transcriptional regulator [Paenibacillus sp. BSR1-1]MDN3017197.1 TetR family transcriptional regulator [Paenibacillus sp. BSR1-1]